MIIRKHNCPYLENHRYCTHKRPGTKYKRKTDCNHSKCEDCELWKHSSSDAEKLILTPINPPLNNKIESISQLKNAI